MPRPESETNTLRAPEEEDVRTVHSLAPLCRLTLTSASPTMPYAAAATCGSETSSCWRSSRTVSPSSA